MLVYFIASKGPMGAILPLVEKHFPNLTAMRRGCVIDAKELVIKTLREGGSFDEAIDSSYEVTDLEANVVLKLTFADAVQIKTRAISV